MSQPTRELPTEKYRDWRKFITITRFETRDDRRALYYVTGGERLLVLTEREFSFLAGLCNEELGNLERARPDGET